ncbi:transcriptional regulator [Vibrio sp. Vb1554]|uniref:transcriptional regulator n=1 Tax=Vibrio TaxID=662 RepID=UPI00080385EC|nr:MULTISPECIES: transcriptional regulator [Vibrio]ANP64535.1 transcriptional regulator [Vibrio alginolyticus]MDW2454461.1 transcriptional regulator [Vibrio sp. 1249-1]MDW3045436.1 transcriptional regulator [Vibrio sp. Vb1554]
MNVGPKFLLAALRQKIKEEGLCYNSLSEKSGIPLSSIKRHLHNPALGLDKVLIYLNYLNTDLVELATLANELQHQNEQMLTDEESALFVEHPYLLDFIYMLTSRDIKPQEIAQTYGLSDTSLRFYLRIAEILGYVENFGDGLFYRSGRRFIMEEGTALDTLFKERFQQDSLSHDINPGVCIGRIRLTEEQKVQIEDELCNKLAKLNAVNTSNNEGELTNILMRCTPGSQIFFADDLPNIDGSLLKLVAQLTKLS